jgi:hypothetical protein
MTDDELLVAVRAAAKALIAAGRKVNYYTIHKSEPRIRARYQRIYAALDHLTASGEVPYSARSRPGGDAPGEMPAAPVAARPKPRPRIPGGERGVYARAMRDIFGRDWLRMYRGAR